MNIKSIIGILTLLTIFHPMLLQANCLYDDCESENSVFEGYTEEDLEGIDINSLMVFKEDLENCQVTEYGCKVTLREAGLVGLYGLFLRTLNPMMMAAEGGGGVPPATDDVVDATKAKSATPSAVTDDVVDATKAAGNTAPPKPVPVAADIVGETPLHPSSATNKSMAPWQNALHNRGSASVRDTFRAIAKNPEQYQINAKFLGKRLLKIKGADGRDIIIQFHRFGGGNSLSVFVCPDWSCQPAGRYSRSILSHKAGMVGLTDSIGGYLPKNFVLDQSTTRGFWRRWVFSKRGFIVLAALTGSYVGYYAVDRFDEEGIVVNFTLEAIEKIRSVLDVMYESLSNEPIDNMLDGGA